VAHDRRIGRERRAWLTTVPEEDVERDWDRVASAMAVSVQMTDLSSEQRVGDLVVYCGLSTGVMTGVAQVVGEPHQRSHDPPGWRIRMLTLLLLDRHIAPSIAAAGSEPPRSPTHLDPSRYRRVRELLLSAAVPLDREAASTGVDSASGGSRGPRTTAADADISATRADGSAEDKRIDDEQWAWLTPFSEEQLDRDWDRVQSAMAISLDAAVLPTLLRVGDLVVYCRSATGFIAGIGTVVREPRPGAHAAGWRLRVVPQLVLSRGTEPSIEEAGIRPPRLPLHLESDTYDRVREVILSAAVSLKPSSRV